MSVRFEMRVPDDLMEKVDAARGNTTRAAWIKGAIERVLSPSDPSGMTPDVVLAPKLPTLGNRAASLERHTVTPRPKGT